MAGMKEEPARQEERLRRLAQDKANIQLMMSLIASLTSVHGLEDTIEAMLRIVLEHVGGTNLSIYYTIDEALFYADVVGARRTVGHN